MAEAFWPSSGCLWLRSPKRKETTMSAVASTEINRNLAVLAVGSREAAIEIRRAVENTSSMAMLCHGRLRVDSALFGWSTGLGGDVAWRYLPDKVHHG
jgi:hypothetical protein